MLTLIKKMGVAILITEQTSEQVKLLEITKEHYLMTKGSILQEDLTVF
jgi:ABC-type branched-subunit amino acid transport system ATPase component